MENKNVKNKENYGRYINGYDSTCSKACQFIQDKEVFEMICTGDNEVCMLDKSNGMFLREQQNKIH